jgi:hypothetical protein
MSVQSFALTLSHPTYLTYSYLFHSTFIDPQLIDELKDDLIKDIIL